MEAIVIKTSEFEFAPDQPMTRVYVATTEHKEVDGFTVEISNTYAIRFVGHVAERLPKDTVLNINPTDEYEIRPAKDVTSGILRAEFKGIKKVEK